MKNTFKSKRSFSGLLFKCLYPLLICLQGCKPDSTQESAWITPEVVARETDATWVDIFFKSIRDKNQNVGIDDLKERKIVHGEYEIRIYSGFGLQGYRSGGHPLDLLIICFSEGNVSSLHYPRSPYGPIELSHPEPDFWNSLYSNRIFDLPDSSTLEDYPRVLDGVSYVVEIKSGDAYACYKYGNPSHSDSKEAGYMLEIISILRSHTTFETFPERPR